MATSSPEELWQLLRLDTKVLRATAQAITKSARSSYLIWHFLLGGTFKQNDWTTTPEPEDTARILAGHPEFLAAMDDPWTR